MGRASNTSPTCEGRLGTSHYTKRDAARFGVPIKYIYLAPKALVLWALAQGRTWS